MFFNQIEIQNYKCFKDKIVLKLERGINVIIGKNNSGKTAILDALSLQFPDKPHYSIETYPKENQKPRSHSQAAITLTLERDEIIDLLLLSKNRGNVDFRLPLDRSLPRMIIDVVAPGADAKSFEESVADAGAKGFGERFFSFDPFTFKLLREARTEKEGRWFIPDDAYVFPQFDRAEEHLGRTQHYLEFEVDELKRGINAKKKISVSGGSDQYREDFCGRVVNELCEVAASLGRYIYRFQAERKAKSSFPLGNTRKLEPDSSNLAEVLHLYLGNATNANKFNKIVRQILPNIHQVAVLPFKNGNENWGRVVVWNTKNSTGKSWLGFSLEDVGSGVSQILGILYVLLTSDDPQVILIDEPQSFLHPDASRKLIEILRFYGEKHQIIIATHSPTVITSADPNTVTLVKQRGVKSILKKIDIHKVDSQRAYLDEIGARLSDIFGYDRILWVEGLTEELCFPKILRKLSKKPLLSTAILHVYQTSDIDRKNKKDIDRIIDIYERLSSTDNGLVPEAVGYIFDKETRSSAEVTKKENKYKNLYFTGRRCYENYLLNPSALTFLVNKTRKNKRITAEEVEEWLEHKKTLETYYEHLKVPKKLDTWKTSIHGKRLLKDFFAEYCSMKKNQKFKERTHSVILTDWILENSPEDLRDIVDLIEKALKN